MSRANILDEMPLMGFLKGPYPSYILFIFGLFPVAVQFHTMNTRPGIAHPLIEFCLR